MRAVGLPRVHAGGLDVVDMHKNIGAAATGSDKAISAICVEEFDPPSWHCSLNPIQRTANAPTRLVKRRAGVWHNALLQVRSPSAPVMPIRTLSQNPVGCR